MTIKLKNLHIISLLSLLIFGVSCDKKKEIPGNDVIRTTQIDIKNLKVNETGLSELQATIKTVHGNIVFKFYPKKSPITVARIITLIKSGFYDGLTFHRVIDNFIIQGGSPDGSAQGGSGQKLKAEFNNLQHVKGTVAMARLEADDDSADSQFYIALSTLPHLDGKYTIFGQVINGIEVLDKIKANDKIISLTLKTKK